MLGLANKSFATSVLLLLHAVNKGVSFSTQFLSNKFLSLVLKLYNEKSKK